VAWEHLAVDESGVRPGHPVSDRTIARTSLARDRLLTSTNTVRKMAAEGSLGGYWRRTGSRTTFYVYVEDVETYIRCYGPLHKKRRNYWQLDPTPLKDLSRPESARTEAGAEGREVSELRASLTALAERVSALEGEFESARQPSAYLVHPRSGIDREQRRRLELEDALAALEEDDALVAEADALKEQAYTKLRSAHRQLRASIARTRQPRTVADLPGIAGDGES
jgi:hypothetical protein